MIKNIINSKLCKTPQEKIFASALYFLGTDSSPKDEAPDEYGCADSVSQIIKAVYDDFKGSVSTAQLYNNLLKDKRFIKVKDFQPGDIIISPTGINKVFNNDIKNGHIGIIAENENIFSNNSASGLFIQNFTIESWVKRYRINGGYRIYSFRAIL
jgi:hypothetical protein